MLWKKTEPKQNQFIDKMYHFLIFDKKKTHQKVNYFQLRKCFPYFPCYKANKLSSVFRFPFSLIPLTSFFVSFLLT